MILPALATAAVLVFVCIERRRCIDDARSVSPWDEDWVIG